MLATSCRPQARFSDDRAAGVGDSELEPAPVLQVQRERLRARLGYAWRESSTPQPKKAPQGLALAWWLEQLRSEATRTALLERHAGLPQAVD